MLQVLTKEILQWLAEEDEDKLRELVEYRSKGDDPHFLAYLQEQGVIYSTTEEALDERLQEYGVSLDSLDLQKNNVAENGWLFPVYNAKGEWLYWVNYSNTRDSNKKYLNVVQQGNKDKMVFGLDTLPKALEINQLVWVEGVIDQCRLASYGIPAVATLGTTISDYMTKLSRRVMSNIIIPDNDANGKTTIGKNFGSELQSQLANARTVGLSYVKDIDDCYSEMPEQFFWLMDNLSKESVSSESDA